MLRSPDAIVQSETLAKKYFGNEPAVGKQIWSEQMWWATNQVLRIAASIILISAIGLTWYLNQKQTTAPTVITLSSSKTFLQDTLLNHIPVVLNKQSELVATLDKEKNKATIALKGEASFNVLPDFKGELIVEAEKTFVQHIGTHFNVKAYANDETIEVSVFEGRVRFYTNEGDGIFIEAGGKGIYNKVTGTFTSAAANENAIAYQVQKKFSNPCATKD